MTFSALQL